MLVVALLFVPLLLVLLLVPLLLVPVPLHQQCQLSCRGPAVDAVMTGLMRASATAQVAAGTTAQPAATAAAAQSNETAPCLS